MQEYNLNDTILAAELDFQHLVSVIEITSSS